MCSRGKSAGSGGIKCLAELTVRRRVISALILRRALTLRVFMHSVRVRSSVKSAEGTCVGTAILICRAPVIYGENGVCNA